MVWIDDALVDLSEECNEVLGAMFLLAPRDDFAGRYVGTRGTCSLFASARSTMTSAAVCLWMAQCSLFCTVAKKKRGPVDFVRRSVAQQET